MIEWSVKPIMPRGYKLEYNGIYGIDQQSDTGVQEFGDTGLFMEKMTINHWVWGCQMFRITHRGLSVQKLWEIDV